MSVLDEFEDKLAALRRWVRETSPPFHSAEDYDAAPVPEAEIRRAERQFDVTLPPEYRAFLTRIGAGRAWPGNVLLDTPWGLTPSSRAPFPLSQPMLGWGTPDARAEDEDRLSEEWDAVPKGHGVLQFCDYGCGIEAVLILNGPFAGRVWVVTGEGGGFYGPFGGVESLHEGAEGPLHRDYPFLEWYENWLDGQLSEAGLRP